MSSGIFRSTAARIGLDVQVLVGRNDRRVHFGPGEQLAVVGGDEVGPDLGGDELRALGLDLGQADEVDLRMARRDLAAEQADAARADDGEADAFGVLLHATARTDFDGAIPTDTASLRSAERSAAM